MTVFPLEIVELFCSGFAQRDGLWESPGIQNDILKAIEQLYVCKIVKEPL